jgi:tetratricopeptide (TPR) repeat protein
LSEEINYNKGLADGYFNLGNSYYFHDDFHPTVTSYLKALRIYEHLPVSMEYAMLCLQLYAMNLYTGRYENSLKYAHRALELYHELDDTLGIINASFKLEVVYGMINECDSSLAHLESALFYLERMPDQNILAALYNELGRAYRCIYDNTGDTLYFEKAISSLKKGLALKNPNIWRTELLFNYGEMQLAYGGENTYYEGISFLHKSLKQSQSRAESKRFQPLICRILGWERYLKGDVDSALLLAHQAISTADNQLSTLSIADFDFPCPVCTG